MMLRSVAAWLKCSLPSPIVAARSLYCVEALILGIVQGTPFIYPAPSLSPVTFPLADGDEALLTIRHVCISEDSFHREAVQTQLSASLR